MAKANVVDDKPDAAGVGRHQPPAVEIQPPELPVPKLDPKLSAAYRKAVLLNQHGLDDLAKAELIDIVMGKASPQEKAKALYLLGSIAFSEKRIVIALSTWRELVATYPESPEAVDVRDRIAQLAEMAGEGAKESADNAVAESYLRNADFWSGGRDQIFGIDSSWIPHVEAAIKWYDKVITEFPGTTASRMAHEDKLFTILGWKDRRYEAIRYGLEADFDKFMPMMQESLAAFEKEHPNASAIQAFRFQIAQAYWRKKDFDNARIWLNKIVAAAGDIDSFYGHLAKERLVHMQ
jgi:tetratricopeptide (TPR) repeat protein